MSLSFCVTEGSQNSKDPQIINRNNFILIFEEKQGPKFTRCSNLKCNRFEVSTNP